MTPVGFPHSEIPGSQLAWQLPEAYRSLPRPSSPPGTKASTVCPYFRISLSLYSSVNDPSFTLMRPSNPLLERPRVNLVEVNRFELMTSCVQGRRSPS
jgi:hypothetical protein